MNNNEVAGAAPYAAATRHAGAVGPEATSASGVSWGAIFAGAAASAALSLILLIAGVGLGMATSSPWANRGADASTIGIAGILWITITGLLASGMGGYLAGRLRTKWSGVHTDEVYFRDTVHGFLAWAVATLVTAAVLTSAVGSIVGAGAQAGASIAGGAATAATAATAGAATAGANSPTASAGTGYYVDALFRKAAAPAADASSAASTSTPMGMPSTSDTQSSAQTTAEVTRIFANSIRTGDLPAADVTYVGQLVAQRTGLSQAEAEKRVTDTYAQARKKIDDAAAEAKEAADKARKASAYTALWLFISLLIAAFSASFAATIGGRQRDR